MKYKRVFLDANIILDIYDKKRPFYKESSTVISLLLRQSEIELFTSCDIITTLYYILSKKGKKDALDSILALNELCNIVEFSNIEIDESCKLMKENKYFTDLEDTIQYIIAKKASCDLILSNDKKFVSDEITLMSSKEFLSSVFNE